MRGGSSKRLWQNANDAGIVQTSPLGVRALWAGTAVSVPRSMMSTSVMMTSNSKFKEVLGEGEWLSPRMITAVAALGAAACSVYSIAPIDIVRARIYAPLLEGGTADGVQSCFAIGNFKVSRKVLLPVLRVRGWSSDNPAQRLC